MSAFLLRLLAPPDLLLLGYGRSWTEAEGWCNGGRDMCPLKSSLEIFDAAVPDRCYEIKGTKMYTTITKPRQQHACLKETSIQVMSHTSQ